MRYLPLLIFVVFIVSVSGQSPHGDDFDLDCTSCHTTDGWKINRNEIDFDHSSTGFEMMGQHGIVDCKSCHTTLEFSKVKKNCFECHTDIHENTLGKECSECHNSNSWVVTNITEIHQVRRFPLIGNHLTANCNQCHQSASNLRYEPIGIECFDCHSNDYNSTQNPNHAAAGFSTDCQECHGLDGTEWGLQNFIHDYFPLTGVHNISNCFECHTQNSFTGLSSDCAFCHQDDYDAAVNPNHKNLNLPVDCAQCHSTQNPGWQPAAFAIHDQIYPLIGAHNIIRNDCAQCHNGNYEVAPPTECFGCHENDYNSVQDPPHAQLNFSTDCVECHNQNSWIPSTFDHDAQYFPIYSGKHNGEWTDCSDCHTNNTNYQQFECINCHEHNKSDTDNEHQGLNGYVYQSQACFDCHPTGEGVSIDHNTTNFPLTGSHVGVDCSSCHINGFAGTSTLCVDCHTDDRTAAPNHVAQNYPTECQTCHNTTAWNETTFDHNQTNFPLTGSHIGQDCNSCHSGVFQGTSTLCADCHLDNFNSTVNPNHQTLNLQTTCETCHTTDPGWSPAQFPNHNDFYLLTGAHASISSQCIDCHNNDYVNTPNNCFGCHNDDYNATNNPPHQSTGFSTDCETCHSQNAWTPSTFDHDGQYFPIYSGKHQGEWNDCSDCHNISSNYAVFECINCHEHNKNDTDNQHNGVQGYVYISTECFACHPDGTSEGAFNHNLSQFPLLGAHLNANCIDCHQTGYASTPSQCVSCHEDSYLTSQNPNHTNLGLSNDCAVCHNSETWTPSLFEHQSTGFELLGQHTAALCADCHTNGTVNTPSQCYDCHEDKYTTAPDHQASSYPTNCEMCHNSVAWDQTTFDHAQTNFPLSGAHITTICSDCHSQGFTGTTTICVDCHIEDFQNTTNPNHQSLNIQNTCETCHSTEPGWQPAQFPNHNDFYLLAGAHASISNQCNDCHNNDYVNTPNNCFGCHNDDYNATNNPPHQSTGFSTDCETCHSQNAWTPSTFDHDGQYFPIYSGKHDGEWNVCSDCHNISSNYAVFECINCHEHNKNDTDDEHTGVQGYVYISTECFACHPDGTSEGAFNHTISQFPLLGAHLAANCIDCHQTGYASTPKECVSCHENSFNTAQNPNHTSLGLSSDCATCHNSEAWTPSLFEHQSTGFELLGQHTSAICADCHTNGTVNTPNQCMDCHEDKYTTAPDHQSSAYPTNCDMCHNSTAWNQTTFDHAQTNFPLSGGHTSTVCSDCHSEGFTGTTTICVDCHIDDFQNSTNPNHQSLNIQNTCETCHNTEPGWSPAQFPDHNSVFALIGAHSAISNDCQSCHNGNYNTTAAECFGCHETDFNSTIDPDHSTANFPLDCESCHTQSAWIPSTFDHDGQYFPIYSGKHQGEWNNCVDCHTVVTNFSLFSCIDCHEHNQSSMNNEHQGVQNYSYNSIACLDCHPDGDDKILLKKSQFEER